MIKVNVIRRDGTTSEISGTIGQTLMETIRANGFDEMLALCGGCCSCATCHVFVEQGPSDVARSGSDDENDLLDSSDSRQVNSRLSCQVILTPELDNLTVRIAPED